jgi:DNA replication and repair protein RecF
MIITKLSLNHFRNHTSTQLSWGSRLNIITGPNGAGKTNLIDAIHFLCMSRSFATSSDQYIIQSGEKEFSVEGAFEGSIRTGFKVHCSYSRSEGKRFLINDSPLDKLSDLIGMVPVVVLSPDDKKLTSEGPSERRSFLDAFISQLSKSYLKELLEYRKILKQRNALLSNQSFSQSSLLSLLEPWNEQLLNVGTAITFKRATILSTFSAYLDQGYEQIAGIGHRPELEYKAGVDDTSSLESIRDQFATKIESEFQRERDRQITLVGPHRDDILFKLNDLDLRKYGSQGQHRLFALALKLAQRNYFESELDDLPIFLLDDVFGDLDPHKTKVLVEMLRNQSGQTFITAANKQLFTDFLSQKEHEIHYYHVQNGSVNHSDYVL